ncbi:MAG: flagellar export protein FliJ [Thiomicrospira sp.]|uniref:flagellar export protein FliJ n=1 Tax=Thiomicrospira sp. TaxID=935 RepID=UPI001A0EA628|nr:flagellar export protein FliJ [Thiomicrospira sp.]MBE0494524.1 flagellar export protein FliJ [Thiomicrospira sp.]
MSRSKRMKVIAGLAEDEMTTAHATLKEVTNQRNYVQVQMNDLKQYLNEYVAKLTTSGQQFMPIQLQTTQAFIEKLKTAIASQQEQLDSLEDIVKMAHDQWTEKRVRFNALHKVCQKLERDERVALDRAEQKLMDDLAAQNFLK